MYTAVPANKRNNNKTIDKHILKFIFVNRFTSECYKQMRLIRF